LESRVKQFEYLLGVLPVEPIVLSPFDAELFGHWWFEGPEFLKSLPAQGGVRPAGLPPFHAERLLEAESHAAARRTAASSWGNKGYWEVWLDQCNSWIYPHLHAAARRMTECARLFAVNPAPVVERVLRQMARELLLAQSSDWAFLMKTGTAREYATQRTKEHLLRFTRLYEKLVADESDTEFVEFCEARDNIFPDVQWRYYA